MGAGERAFAAGADIAEITNNKAVEAEQETCPGQGLTDLILNSGEANSVVYELYLGMIENLRAHRAEEMNRVLTQTLKSRPTGH
jgi:enoyl-CoA hydratase/carnithine racemase